MAVKNIVVKTIAHPSKARAYKAGREGLAPTDWVCDLQSECKIHSPRVTKPNQGTHSAATNLVIVAPVNSKPMNTVIAADHCDRISFVFKIINAVAIALQTRKRFRLLTTKRSESPSPAVLQMLNALGDTGNCSITRPRNRATPVKTAGNTNPKQKIGGT